MSSAITSINPLFFTTIEKRTHERRSSHEYLNKITCISKVEGKTSMHMIPQNLMFFLKIADIQIFTQFSHNLFDVSMKDENSHEIKPANKCIFLYFNAPKRLPTINRAANPKSAISPQPALKTHLYKPLFSGFFNSLYFRMSLQLLVNIFDVLTHCRWRNVEIFGYSTCRQASC